MKLIKVSEFRDSYTGFLYGHWHTYVIEEEDKLEKDQRVGDLVTTVVPKKIGDKVFRD